jgi:hypothetical protein
MKRNITFLIVNVLLSMSLAQPAEASTSLAKAKSMIRDLYYGQQQAAQRSISAENSYIVSRIYPGMYTNPRKCLMDLEAQYGSGYGPAVPNLSTVDFDKNWVIPTGLPLNKLSGKKPKGETFVVDVNWTSGISTNHVTILNGKAYYFLWVCGS